jgi:hypothetical protein
MQMPQKAANPATCGLDIEVPLMTLNDRPLFAGATQPRGCPVLEQSHPA